ncbi:MAG: hypothetical protein ABEK02_09630 [Haloquadratum sp.]
MDLEELRSVRRTERQKDSLQHLRDSFYEDVADYIAERKAERRRAADAADDPFSDPDVGRLTDEIETAEDVVEAVYERRVGKVVKLASFAAADMGADTDGLTAEERDLFDDLVARIKQNRETVLEVLAGEGDEGESADDAGEPANEPGRAGTTESNGRVAETAAAESKTAPGSTTAPEDGDEIDEVPPGAAAAPDDILAEAMSESGDRAEASADSVGDSATSPDSPQAASDTSGESAAAPDAREVPPDAPPDAPPGAPAPAEAVVGNGGAEGANAGETADEAERVTLRITEDVGQIFGVDEREYELASEDVVTLPSTNAGPLLDRDAAERLD